MASDNPSGEYCPDCRAVGMYHCSDPANCGGMRARRSSATPTPVLSTKPSAALDKLGSVKQGLDEEWPEIAVSVSTGAAPGIGDPSWAAPPSLPVQDERAELAQSKLLHEAWQAWLHQHGVPISMEFVRLANAVGIFTELARASRSASADGKGK